MDLSDLLTANRPGRSRALLQIVTDLRLYPLSAGMAFVKGTKP